MYAVIESGGKQHRVVEGEVLKLEKIELGAGESVEFDKVLLVSDGAAIKVGSPYVAGAKVTAEVVAQGRHDKINIIKFRRRKHHMKRAGHRQWYTEVKITGISG
ncbi:MAG TPA: 50S ribosomal protein L21 [Spongiibacteraceae bacterium]|nr:50S ribosomal protein L21 [Spongiibacteraceae bacterium]HUH36781.1 50S ribosomal protein L21 [Spongiibacteraceae bacterium]